MMRLIFIFSILFGFVIFLAIFPRLRETEFKSRAWVFLRILFPSWRFFETIGWVPKLWYRASDKSGEVLGAWQECLPAQPRSIGSLFLNAQSNLRMAGNALVEQFAHDLEEMENNPKIIEQSVSYALTQRLVRFFLRASGKAEGNFFFQFKVAAIVPGKDEDARGEDIFISRVHEI